MVRWASKCIRACDSLENFKYCVRIFGSIVEDFIDSLSIVTLEGWLPFFTLEGWLPIVTFKGRLQGVADLVKEYLGTFEIALGSYIDRQGH